MDRRSPKTKTRREGLAHLQKAIVFLRKLKREREAGVGDSSGPTARDFVRLAEGLAAVIEGERKG